MEFIKKNFKVILIVIFCLLWLQKCGQSCSRKTTINKQNTEINILKDSIVKSNTIIKELETDNNSIKELIETEKKYSSGFMGVAMDNQKKLTEHLYNAKKEIIELKKENRKLKTQIDTTKL